MTDTTQDAVSAETGSIYWKRNLVVSLLGSFTTIVAMTLLLPFLPLYVEELGVSDHAAGDALPSLLGRLKDASPGLAVEVRVGLSQDLLASYEEGDFDAVIVRQERSNRGGELLTDDPYGWFASPSFKWEMGAPLALASLSPTCGVRAIAVRALDKAGIPWREVFVGGGVAALAAAIDAGLGAAVLARNVAPSGGIDIGGKYGLPPLPRSRVVLHARASDPETSEVLELVAALFRRK